MKRTIPPLPKYKLQKACQTRSQGGSSKLINHNNISNDNDVSKDMLQILKEENNNLKNQNIFLLGKLRIFGDKQTYHQQMEKKYQGIVGELRNKNKYLEDQLNQLNELTQIQMKKMNQKITEIATEQNNRVILEKSQEKIRDFSLSAFMEAQQQIQQKPQNETMTSRQLEHLGSEFKKLLQEGKESIEFSKKKQIRKNMMEILNRMQQIKKLNQL